MFIEIYDGITPILGYFLDYENKLWEKAIF